MASVGQEADGHALTGERRLIARTGPPLVLAVAIVVTPALHPRFEQRKERAPHGVCAAHVAPFGIGRTAPLGDGCRPRYLSLPYPADRRFRASGEFGHGAVVTLRHHAHARPNHFFCITSKWRWYDTAPIPGQAGIRKPPWVFFPTRRGVSSRNAGGYSTGHRDGERHRARQIHDGHAPPVHAPMRGSGENPTIRISTRTPHGELCVNAPSVRPAGRRPIRAAGGTSSKFSPASRCPGGVHVSRRAADARATGGR